MLSESVFAVQMAVRTADRLAKDDEEIDGLREIAAVRLRCA